MTSDCGTASSYLFQRLDALLHEGILTRDESVLVVCGGSHDRRVLDQLGFRDVTITSIAEDPLETIRCADAHSLPFGDMSFDSVLVHAGLHHCSSPHRALTEMYRIARRTAVVFEAQDSITVRLLSRLGLALDYEVDAVVVGNGESGGVDNGPIPNYVYRWTRREVEKLLRSLDPAREPDIRFHSKFFFDPLHFSGFMGAHALTRLLGQDRLATLVIRPGVWLLNTLVSSQGNCFSFVIRKGDDRLQPWLTRHDDVIRYKPPGLTG